MKRKKNHLPCFLVTLPEEALLDADRRMLVPEVANKVGRPQQLLHVLAVEALDPAMKSVLPVLDVVPDCWDPRAHVRR